eukprot:6212135-Pleurochrysis_carterae.AAC.1
MSRIMLKVFCTCCVREALRRDSDSSLYLQRRDHPMRANGFAAKHVKPKSELDSLYLCCEWKASKNSRMQCVKRKRERMYASQSSKRRLLCSFVRINVSSNYSKLYAESF